MPAFYKEWFYKTKRSLTAMVITKPQPKALTFTGVDSVKDLCRTIGRHHPRMAHRTRCGP